MATNKYYLNKNGLIELVKDMSSKIRNNTTNSITFETVTLTDPQTNELILVLQLQNPKKVTTANAVVNYLKTHNRVTINQEYTTVQPGSTVYSVNSDSHTYAGDEDKTLEIRLITAVDIDGLFPQQ